LLPGRTLRIISRHLLRAIIPLTGAPALALALSFAALPGQGSL